jgi:putative aminopeptidase FrvX
MNKREFCRIAKRLLQKPAAPYHEQEVRAEVEKICREHRLNVKADRWGNLFVRLQVGRRQRPIVLAAHMDHPGFEIIRGLTESGWLAQFRGGVPATYFKAGVRLRLVPGNTPATLGKCVGEKVYEIHTPTPAGPAPEFAVWDLENFDLRKGRIHARACDDLIGVACILATLIELKRTHQQVNVIGVLSRAEEVGFHGALMIASSGELPKQAFVISLETSRELPGSRMGDGVILRVGDKASIFDSEATRFLSEIALEVKQPGFKYQRALMGGGTCEATAYQEFGFRSAAVCVALGNYHNCGKGGKIESEYVDLQDAQSMVSLLKTVATQDNRYKSLVGRLPKRLHELLKEAKRELSQGTRGQKAEER